MYATIEMSRHLFLWVYFFLKRKLVVANPQLRNRTGMQC